MTHREPRPDLGLEITLFYFRDRNGAGRLTVRIRDVFGTPLELAPETFASMLEATARDVRAHAQKAAPDPLAPEPHDWTRFEELERLFVGAESETDLKRRENILRNRATVREARAAFEAPERMVFVMSRHGHKVEAWTPDQFVDLWRKGYR